MLFFLSPHFPSPAHPCPPRHETTLPRRRLPNREYLIEPGGPEERRVLLGLADILFAYAYDHRTTTGDPSVESAWTVAVLSPLLSWLEVSGLVGENGSGALSQEN